MAENMVAATIYYVCKKHPKLPSLGKISRAFRIRDKEIESAFQTLDRTIRVNGKLRLVLRTSIPREPLTAGVTLPREYFYELLALGIKNDNKDAICVILPDKITILAPHKLIFDRSSLEKAIGDTISNNAWYYLAFYMDVFGLIKESSLSRIVICEK
ncbi:MAG: hypothetical protein QMD36_06710 [Candidatus Aenigmarchaeota archaeon]|nr:hypothetical protein [Candidatus Aenigmarchaeota archaeon]